MSAVRKAPPKTTDPTDPTDPTDSPFNLSVPFAPKTTRPRAPRNQAAAKLQPTETASPLPAEPEAAVPPVAEPALPRRRRLAKAFERPLDKVLRKKSEALGASPQKLEKATVRDGFTFPKAEHDRLVELKKQLAMQGVDVKKSDLIRVGLILALSLPPTKLKAVLARLPPVK